MLNDSGCIQSVSIDCAKQLCTTKENNRIEDNHLVSPLARLILLALGGNGLCKDVCTNEYADQGNCQSLSIQFETLCVRAGPHKKNCNMIELCDDPEIPVRGMREATTRTTQGP